MFNSVTLLQSSMDHDNLLMEMGQQGSIQIKQLIIQTVVFKIVWQQRLYASYSKKVILHLHRKYLSKVTLCNQMSTHWSLLCQRQNISRNRIFGDLFSMVRLMLLLLTLNISLLTKIATVVYKTLVSGRKKTPREVCLITRENIDQKSN